jgi:hypothetical protein
VGWWDSPKPVRWPPPLVGGEIVLVHCALEARRRVPFRLMVTSRRLMTARMGFLGLLVLREVALDKVRRAELGRVRPTGYWAAGALLFVAFIAYAWAVWHDATTTFDWRALALLGFGTLAFSAGKNRWQLTVHTNDAKLRIVQPATSREWERDQMASALRDAHAIASAPHELARRTAEARALADPDAA